MPRHIDPADLPEAVARFAEAEVAAGRYASVEDVLIAAVEALRQRAEAEQEWPEEAQTRAFFFDTGTKRTSSVVLPLQTTKRERVRSGS